MPPARPRRPCRRAASPLAGLALLAASAASVGLNTRLDDPPRFDGAGYALLGRALAVGAGYRSIHHPGAPRHVHFPPGYPIALAALWRGTGVSVPAAHLLSIACTIGAVLATWRWFRGRYGASTAFALGVGLAVNWTWGRNGGSIQSEPLYLLLAALALLLADAAGRRGGASRGAALGLALGACVLTRHVGVALAAAVGLDLLLRRRLLAAGAAAVAAAAVVAPWAAWQAGAGQGTQVGLFSIRGLPGLVAGQALFYARRIPDAILGPYVEVATVFGRSPAVAALATAGALAATALVLLGWWGDLRRPRRRPVALVPLATLALLLAWPFTEAGRFLVPLVPFLLAGAAGGLSPVLRRLGARRPRRLAAWLLAAASVPYAAYAIASDRAGAQQRTHAAFDAACAWIRESGDRPGPVLARHPADVAWATGRQALAPGSDDPSAIADLIDRHGVAYLLVDPEPYANAPPTPLARFVAARPGRARLAWSGPGGLAVFTVLPESAP